MSTSPRKIRSGKATDRPGGRGRRKLWRQGLLSFHNFTGPGARFGLKKRCWNVAGSTTQWKKPSWSWRENVCGLVWFGSGILRFLKSSGVQACLQIFRGSLWNGSSLVWLLRASFQTSSSSGSIVFPRWVKQLTIASWWWTGYRARGGWFAQAVLLLPQWRPRKLSTRLKHCKTYLKLS